MEINKAVVTGPTGAVGVSLIEELLANGAEVTAICRPGSRRIGSIPQDARVRIVECGADRLLSLAEALPRDHDAFYHFAWDGTYGAERQDLYRQSENIRYTLDAVRLASALGCRVFLGAGSQSEFGRVEGVLRPDLPCHPETGYGAAKLAAGHMSRLECRKRGLRHIWCRILSLYGPCDGAHTMVMSSVYTMLRGERQQFTPAEQIWDYIYSRDAARAFRLAAERGRDGAVYCLGSGEPRRLRDYILAIRDAIDPTLEVGIGEREYYPDQVMHLEADISRLTEDTGFRPRYSFEAGIRETIRWAKNHLRNEDGML